jgi:RNA polymerase sigma factor (sigma-70 family)
MPGIRLAALVRRLRRDATPDAGECADAALVARFAATRDEAAFELLVRRHGAMVLAACRRVLGHTEDAEDAFQAAFLVLARKAASVRRGTAVPAWLHRVAVRIARRAADRRRPTTTLVEEPPAPPTPDEAERSELRGLLDAEIDRLSEPVRRAFVLCYLEGLSNAHAAQVLGCPVGTVESRLTAARRTLRDRLARRIELPIGILALLAGAPGLPADTVATTTRAGVMAAQRGLRAAIGIVGEPAARLAEGGLRTMTRTTRLWAALTLGVALIGLASGVVWASRPTAPPAELGVAADPPAVAPAPKTAREPEAKGQAWPLAKHLEMFVGPFIGVAPDGKSILTLQRVQKGPVAAPSRSIGRISLVDNAVWTVAVSQNILVAAAVSPDGKYIATAEGENGVKLRDAKGQIVEALWPRSNLPALTVAFTPDGTKLVVYCEDTIPESGMGKGKFPRMSTTTKKTCVSVWDLSTRKELGHPTRTDTNESSALPQHTLAGHGRFVLKTQTVYDEALSGPGGPGASTRFSIMDAVSGKEGKPVNVEGTSLGPVPPDPLSPDGKTLVLVNASRNELHFLDSDTGKDRFPVTAFRRPVMAVVFSPDGRFVAAGTGRGGTETIAAPSEVAIWDAATGKELARLTDKETVRDYTALAFSPDGSFLAAQSRTSVTIWGHLPAPDPVPEPVKLKANAPGAGATPARLQALLSDLSGGGVTDARRVEALFLAALGRFPTDVEARTLAAQLARRDDKAAALRDLLGTLTETNEFRTHAEELGRLAK